MDAASRRDSEEDPPARDLLDVRRWGGAGSRAAGALGLGLGPAAGSKHGREIWRG